MISVSGKYWEEEKVSKRLFEKIKLDYNFKDITINQILSNNFDTEEILSLENHLELSNPFMKKSDFINGINLLDETIKNNQNICIIGDYDVDGCISTSLLVKFLKKLNAKYYYYIPNRFIDGYGSSINLIKKIILKNPNLVIMIDNGSSSNEAINYLNQNNIKSIIIDHHEIYKPYPKSNILINPKKDSDYKKLDYFCSGVLTYFFIDMFIKKKKLNLNFSNNLHLVLLTIVSDVMPLRKINRIIANKVLKNINLTQEHFFKRVFKVKEIKKKLDIDDFGFLFGPIINSAGRLDDPNYIVKLFTSTNIDIKDEIIDKLISLNEKRKKIENDIINKIDFKKIETSKSPIIIYDDLNISEGLIGIIAAHLKNYFNKPTVIFTKSGKILKGSARSIKNFSIGKSVKKALDYKLLESGGGHNLAAGFTIKKENLKKFKYFLNNSFKKDFVPDRNKYLSKISFYSFNKSFLLDLNKFQPYGENNPNPNFLIENVRIVNAKIIKNKFISCFIKNRSGKLIPAMSFNFLESSLSKNILYNKNEIHMIVNVKENFWNNKKSLQLIIIDILNPSNKA